MSEDNWSKELKERVKVYFIKHCATPEALNELTELIDWVREEKEIDMESG